MLLIGGIKYFNLLKLLWEAFRNGNGIHALIFSVNINHIRMGITEAKFEFEMKKKKLVVFRTMM